MTKEEIGTILKELRIKSGKTQKEVADLIGRKQQVIGHWETGYSQPDLDTLFTLCRIYNTTVDTAFGLERNDITLSGKDISHLEKYHTLNKHTQLMLDYIIETEYGRLFTEVTKYEMQQEAMLNRLAAYNAKIKNAYKRSGNPSTDEQTLI